MSERINDAFVLVCIVLAGFLIIGLLIVGTGWVLGREWQIESCPQESAVSYKSVEPTGVYGSAQYYLFDSTGKRHMVTQSCFDSLVGIPRK